MFYISDLYHIMKKIQIYRLFRIKSHCINICEISCTNKTEQTALVNEDKTFSKFNLNYYYEN